MEKTKIKQVLSKENGMAVMQIEFFNNVAITRPYQSNDELAENEAKDMGIDVDKTKEISIQDAHQVLENIKGSEYLILDNAEWL